MNAHTVIINIQIAANDYSSLESFGVRYCEQPLHSRDGKRAQFILKNTTTRINERYETGLLWQSETGNLPDKEAMATNRPASAERNMKRDAVFAAWYRAIIDDQRRQRRAPPITYRAAYSRGCAREQP